MKNKMSKLAYIFLYLLVIAAFAYLGTRDYTKNDTISNQERFHNDYPDVKEENKFEYLNSNELIDFLNNGTGILFLGDKDSDWSIRYAQYLYLLSRDIEQDKIYYYDVKSIKLLQNSNYYAILKALDGHLMETDSGKNNLFAPSLYIVKDGKVVYHDSTTAVVNNEISVDDYWTIDRIEEFMFNIKNAIKEYC